MRLVEKENFDNVWYWIDQVKKQREEIFIMLVGSKSDSSDNRIIGISNDD